MPIIPPFIILAATGVSLLVVSFVQSLVGGRSPELEDRLHRLKNRRVLERLRQRGFDAEQADLEEEEERIRERRGQIMKWLRERLSPNHWIVEMERDLNRARAPLGPIELLCISGCLMLTAGCSGYWVFNLGYFLFPVGAASFVIPWLYTKRMKARWMHRFERQLSEALVLMANGLRAGYSLLQALEIVGREAEHPIKGEFQQLSQEIAVGVTVEQALTSLVERVRTMDVKIFVSAVLVQRQIGGALSEVLDNLASVIRQRVSLRLEVRTLTAQQRFSAYGLLLLPVFFAIAAELLTRALGGTSSGSPSYLAPLLRVPWLIALGLGMQLMGVLIIRRIVSIEM